LPGLGSNLGRNMNRDEIVSALTAYFEHKADIYNIDMVFLYGSWVGGHPKKESDIDVALVLDKEMDEERIFDIVTGVSLELTEITKKETNILYIDTEFSKPMLYYNAIIHGIPVFMKDFTRYVDMKLKAIAQMEDFSIFGIQWQAEIVKRRLEAFKNA